jgi:serine/threonine protein kinase
MAGPDIGRTDLLSDRYELGDVIGRGGMGVVHRAWDRHLQRDVAVKILRNFTVSPVGRARFRDEGATLARLSHPGLITLFDAQTEDDEPYLVMELVEGEPLNELCAGRGLSITDVATFGAALAEALDHVHRRRVIHRDIKPSNVLIGRDGRVKLADFGVARLIDDLTRYTATGMTMGTVGYLSPEQVRGDLLTPASDIYSLGLVLIEALSGEPAFPGSRDVVALIRLTTSPRIDEALPEPLRELLADMTASDPARRPSAGEVAIELRWLSGAPLAEGTLGPIPARQRAHRAAGASDSLEVPTASGSVPTQQSKPISTPRDGSASRGRLSWALLAALILTPALVLVPALLFAPQINWPQPFGTSTPGASDPARGAADAANRSADPTGAGQPRPTGAPGPTPAATTRGSIAGSAPGSVVGSVPGATASAGAPATVVVPSAVAPTSPAPGATTPDPTQAEADKAAEKAAAAAARAAEKEARESEKAAKGKGKSDG